MKDLSEEITKKIDKKRIKPRPRWHFVVQNIFMWTVFIVTVLIGATAFGVLLRRLTMADWGIHARLGRKPFEHALLILPYHWFMAVAILVGAAVYNFHHTKRGYRYKVGVVVLGSVVASLIIGIIMWAVGGARLPDELAERVSPFASGRMEVERQIWQQPERGLLGGRIISVEDGNLLLLDDLTGKEWQVYYEEAKGARIIEPEMHVRIIGQQLSEDEFKAEALRPWFGPVPSLVEEEIIIDD